MSTIRRPAFEVRQIHDSVRVLDERVVVELVDIVRAEAPALLTEVLVWRPWWRNRQRKQRQQGGRLGRIGDVDHGGVVERLLAILLDGLRVHDRDLPRRQGQHAVGPDEPEERRRGRKLAASLRLETLKRSCTRSAIS